MTKPKNIAIKIVLLEALKREMENSAFRGLCAALNVVHNRATKAPGFHNLQVNLDAAFIDLSRYIRSSMEGHPWLERWQEANGFPNRTKEQAKRDRLAWIDWMIADYKSWDNDEQSIS